MNEKITIPENTRVIIEDGVIIFESKEVKYKAYEWYSCRHTVLLTTEALADNNEFYCSGFELDKQQWVWFEDRCCDVSRLDKADMKEVEKLLIGEAEKIGFKKGVNIKTSFATPTECTGSFKMGENLSNNLFNITKNGSFDGCVFNSKTGKWAEIIEEKKPLYVNSFGTEFFDGDIFHWVHSGIKIVSGDVFDKNCAVSPWCLFMGTERECHRYIYDNWDKLK